MIRFVMQYVLFVGYCSAAYAQNVNPDNFIIKGKYFGKNAKVISFTYRDATYTQVTKDCEIVNGRFSLEGNINRASTIWIASNLTGRNLDDPNLAEVFIEPGNMEILLKENQFKNIKITGSSIQQNYDAVEKSKLPIYARMKPLQLHQQVISDSIDYLTKLNDSIKLKQVIEKRNLIIGQLEPYRSQLNRIEMTYVAHHPNDYLSAYFLETQYSVKHLNIDTAKFYYTNFSANVKNCYWSKTIFIDIERKHGSATGAPAKDFIIKDNKGFNIVLSSFKNKNVVLLDFWASWCVPCREEFPHFKLCYNKYKASGLEIIGISVDRDKEAWLNAIKTDSTENWIHIRPVDGKNDIDETDIGIKYEAHPIPTCYLINKQGIIVGKWEGQSSENEEEINKKLFEIFGF